MKVDPALHQEILTRYKKLQIAPYGGFVNPILEPVYAGDSIVDVKINYTTDFVEQMLHYSKEYGLLPLQN